MMRSILFLFLLIGLAGCSFENAASKQIGKQSQPLPIPIMSNFQVEQQLTPTPSSSKLLIITTNEKGTAVKPTIPPAGIPETNTAPPDEFTSSRPTWTWSEEIFEMLGQKARGSIILQSVALVSQSDYTSCGEAAFTMGWNYLHSKLPLDIGMVATAGLNLGVYFEVNSPSPRGYLGTSPAGMEVIGEYFASKYNLSPPITGNIDLDKGGVYARFEAKGLLYSQLSAGNPVIIEVTDSVGNPSSTYNDSHYVIVTGMNFDTNIVTFNDPIVNLSMSGKYSGLGRVATWSQIWDSWFNNKDVNPGETGHPGRGWYMVVR